MKTWHVIILTVVVTLAVALNFFYVRTKTDEVVRQVRAISSESDKAVNQHLQAVEKSISTSLSATSSNTIQTFSTRLDQVRTSLVAQIQVSSASGSEEMTRRLDSLQSSLSARIEALRTPRAQQGGFGAASDLNKGLVAYYPFDGNASDESGNGNNGIAYGVTWVSDRFGNPSGACRFYGNSGSYIDITPGTSLNLPNEISISLWCTVEGPGTQSPRLVTINTAPYGGSYQMIFASQPRRFAFSCGDAAHEASWSGSIPNGEWFHLVGVGTGTSSKLYVNGVISVSVTAPAVVTFGQTTRMNVGRMAHPGYDAFDGKIDDVRIYNRALTDTEVSALYKLESNR